MSEPELKKIKINQYPNTPIADKNNNRCIFFITKKNRQCGMLKSGQSKDYCTEHLNYLKKKNGEAIHNGKKGKRVPCPLDPNHTCWEIDLKKHLKKCNKLKEMDLNTGKSWFKLNCNCIQASTTIKIPENIKEIIVEKVLPLLENIIKDSPDFIKDPGMELLIDNHIENHRVQNLGNKHHAIQQSSLIQHIKKSIGNTKTDGSDDNNVTSLFIEFGCGRAELSRYLNLSLALDVQDNIINNTNRTNFLLIDRGHNRMKFDNKFKTDVQFITTGNIATGKYNLDKVVREKVDIKDISLLDLIKEDSFNDLDQVVSISKHLCGAATDLTLTCLKNYHDATTTDMLIVIAMCCRHVCDPNNYVNMPFIERILEKYKDCDKKEEDSITPTVFFYALTKLVSWATCGRREGIDDDSTTHFSKKSVEEREQLGMISRRIIDYGRYEYVKTHFCNNDGGNKFGIKLVQYCKPTVSLENVALVLYKK
ncbi:related to tRNA guanosine-2'-O-methyltransferase TRM13 [Saccharomycodes ludwigii]|uniref:tRNA:m(4)X modification enzyme TRM13 n=1 Tax=Saccharomycodes ludwigii TaxID=36035 RepID=A0A376BAQ1_9ASCO|nr:related to tRNA guanosine-2'-O-methyltransferase TRM13 [Saccharomycodes ludwigii]